MGPIGYADIVNLLQRKALLSRVLHIRYVAKTYSPVVKSFTPGQFSNYYKLISLGFLGGIDKIQSAQDFILRGYGTLKYGYVYEKIRFPGNTGFKALDDLSKHFETILPNFPL